ncbi:MAG TPA: hypothetical protein QGF58_02630 [Myxococcota bacterium]|nr:hypothetical protein [Myxococcota bacterium]
MKKYAIGLGVLLVAALGYLAAAHLSGGQYPTLGIPGVGGHEAMLRKMSLDFWEDIQFKDFEKAATYHEESMQDEVDIPFLLDRLYGVPPESMDIQHYEVVFVDIDSSGLRARVKCRVKALELTREKVRDQEIILYYYRDSVDDPWHMKLEDSLRKPESDKDKKH